MILNLFYILKRITDSPITLFLTLKPVLAGQDHPLREGSILDSGQEEMSTPTVLLRHVACSVFI